MADERSAEAVAFGFIPVRLGQGDPINLPTLKIATVREWKAKLAKVAADRLPEFVGLGGHPERAADTATESIDFGLTVAEVIFDLVASYDVGNVLGGREVLEANLDDTQVYALFRAILAVHFPFVTDMREAIQELSRLLNVTGAVASMLPSSPSGPSRNGTSDPRKSKRPSMSRS